MENPQVTGAGRAQKMRRGLVVVTAVSGVLLASGCRTDEAADVDRVGGSPSAGASATDGATGDRPESGGDLKVTGVALAVVPTTLSAVKCKTAVPQSYTAVISFAGGHQGGEITVRYGAASSTMKEETLSVPAGETSLTKNFFHSEYIVSNSLAAAQVNVVEPQLVQSATVRPTGVCNESGFWDSDTASGGATGGY
ncbi:hypothetical protein ACH5A7_37945 [Streptomyces sp. NPDC018955]|uniref:hypothetical protein n=1 Tax=Streptomyces sp. NPDC018955 TaxID=3365055 RepID=UPI0037B71928